MRQWLSSSRLGLYLAAISFGISLRSVTFGLQADDHILLELTRIEGRVWNLFRLDPSDLARASPSGVFAWWSNPRLSVNFFRPISSLSHALEFRYWPDSAWAMHLTNILLYVAIVLTVWRIYQRLIPDRSQAGLAALLFTVAEGHGAAVGWIAARNGLLAALFGSLALLAQVRARELRFARAASALSIGLALLSAEAAVGGVALLIAYALTFESGRFLQRLRTIAPQLAVAFAWAIAYAAMGCGAFGTSWYRELAHPLELVTQGALDLPVLLASLFGPGVMSFGLAFPANAVRAIALGLVAAMSLLLVPVVPRNQTNAFFAIGTLLCLPPLFMTLPQDRTLLIASLGGCGLLASFIHAAAAHAKRVVRMAGGGALFWHLGLAPLLFLATLDEFSGTDDATRAMIRALPDPLPHQVVFLDLPVELLTVYANAIMRNRDPNGSPIIEQLYAGMSELTIERIDERTLELRPTQGWGHGPFERVFCSARDMPRPTRPGEADARSQRELRISVIESNDAGMPSRVRFQFPTPLESNERAFFVWQGTRPIRWHPPAAGRSVTLPARDFATSM